MFKLLICIIFLIFSFCVQIECVLFTLNTQRDEGGKIQRTYGFADKKNRFVLLFFSYRKANTKILGQKKKMGGEIPRFQ